MNPVRHDAHPEYANDEDKAQLRRKDELDRHCGEVDEDAEENPLLVTRDSS